MYDVNTHDVRRFFAHVWKNRLTPLQLDALQHKALRIIESHPEYTHYLEKIEDYLDKNWLPEDGESNPFLHMSLHLSRAGSHRPAAGHTGDSPATLHTL